MNQEADESTTTLSAMRAAAIFRWTVSSSTCIHFYGNLALFLCFE